MAFPEILAGQKLTADFLASMQPGTAIKTATTSRATDVTPTADPELSLAVVAGAEYLFSFYWRVSGVDAADIALNPTTPSGATGSYSMYRKVSGGTSGAEAMLTTRLSFNVLTRFATTSTTAHEVLEGTGRLTMGGTSGNFVIVWSQGTSDATATAMHADSWIKLERVA